MAAITSAQSGNWSSTATWVGGVVPGNGDTVVVAAAHTVTVDVNATIGTAGATGVEALLVSSTGTLVINAGVTLSSKGDVNVQRGAFYTQNGHLEFIVGTGVVYYLKQTTAGTGLATIVVNGPSSSNRATIKKTGLGTAAIDFSAAATLLYTRLNITNLTCFDLGSATIHAYQHYTFAAVNYSYFTNVAFIRCGSVRASFNHADVSLDWNNVLISQPLKPLETIYISGATAKGTGIRRFRNLYLYSEVDATWYNVSPDVVFENLVVVNCNPAVTTGTLRNTQTEVLCMNDLVTPSGKTLWATYAKSTNTYNKVMFIAHSPNQHYCGGGAAGLGISNVWTNTVFDGDGYNSGDAGDCFMNSEKIECYNTLAINKAGTLFSGLQAAASFYIRNFTCHNAFRGALGENNGAATQLELLANGLVVNQNAGIGQLAAFQPMQDTAYVDYIGFFNLNGASRINDPVLGVPGYLEAETYGTWWATGGVDGRDGRCGHSKNVDPQFKDPSRTIRTWVGSFLGTDTSNTTTWPVTAMGAEVIKNSGLDKNGTVVTAWANSLPVHCHAYLLEGFTPQNAAYKATGLGGLDYGAFPVIPSGGGSSNNTASSNGFLLGMRYALISPMIQPYMSPIQTVLS